MAEVHNETSGGTEPVIVPVQVHRIGGWKLTAGAMIAAAGLGFGGFVYAVPYHSVKQAVRARDVELGQQKTASSELARQVEKLKADLEVHETADEERAASEAKRRQEIEALVGEVKVPLGAFGATTTVVPGGKVVVSLASSATFDRHTSTVISTQGEAALTVLGAAVKRFGFRTRVKARLIQARPPHDLAQFQSIGEFVMLRAVRVALALANVGVAADHVAAAGEEPPPLRIKGRPAIPERMDVEIEPG